LPIDIFIFPGRGAQKITDESIFIRVSGIFCICVKNIGSSPNFQGALSFRYMIRVNLHESRYLLKKISIVPRKKGLC
jgi:hypothetical protein